MNGENKTLITGATGFLGGTLLSQIIQKENFSKYLFLVRAKNADEGRSRLISILVKHEIPESYFIRLKESQIILGDLSSPIDFLKDPRINDVTKVINSAAIASFAPVHIGLNKVNVVGTFQFIEGLSKIGKVKRFIHVGTAMCVGQKAPKLVREDYVPDGEVEHVVPYTKSKLELEQMVRERLPQFPFVAARPSIVVGHSKLGVKPSGSIFWVFRAAHSLGKFTCDFNDKIDVVPADWVAEGLLLLEEKEDLKYNFYHLSAGPNFASKFGDLDTPLAKGRNVAPLGQSYQKVSNKELEAMRPTFRERLGKCNTFVMQQALVLYGQFASLSMVFENQRILEEGLRVPPSFASYAELCMQTSLVNSIETEMMSDFK